MSKKIYLAIYKNDFFFFSNWEECKQFVQKKPNIIYKGFKSKEEADVYLKNYKENNSPNQLHYNIDIYSDGSYEPSTNRASWAWVAIEQKKIISENSGVIRSKNHSRNIDGELQAVLNACAWSLENSIDGFNLYFDYIGIEYWAKGQWKTNTDLSINYQKSIKPYLNRIKFYKVKSHSDDFYNNYVDNLAKKALKNDY